MCVAPYYIISKLYTIFHSWTLERTFICKENDTESESGSGIIVCTWICTMLLACVYGNFIFLFYLVMLIF